MLQGHHPVSQRLQVAVPLRLRRRGAVDASAVRRARVADDNVSPGVLEHAVPAGHPQIVREPCVHAFAAADANNDDLLDAAEFAVRFSRRPTSGARRSSRGVTRARVPSSPTWCQV